MKIWLDNDGCPRMVREHVMKIATVRGIAVHVVGNSYVHLPKHPLIQFSCVSTGFDAADQFIIDNCEKGELVITSDIPLAAKIVEKGALGLSSRGELFDSAGIGERLAMRNLMQELRSGGEIQGGPPPLSDGDKKRFADAFDRVLAKLK